ncbi:DUF4234 domain-containing protein [Alkaliphilus peptidifermentans]|uniref:DUF4234 domain-containing protein n=1 Tax=Alkaliphilus peptidifermentans DSM 18978 TaxID=1120976 RepID=A0A1G5K7G0_9FIRM|nr:DUF4234 domain-containing protein [Alkaliphilus peptidifermentans]SCY96562.1 protein of unknown function [Alkaliphilus peptidifermentans DSM 18978]
MEKRNIGLAILFTFITFGIYGLFWFVKLTNEVSDLSGDTSMSGGKALLFTILTCGIYSIYWAYQMGKLTCKAQENKKEVGKDNSVLYLILSIFGLSIIVFALVQSDINNMIG